MSVRVSLAGYEALGRSHLRCHQPGLDWVVTQRPGPQKHLNQGVYLPDPT